MKKGMLCAGAFEGAVRLQIFYIEIGGQIKYRIKIRTRFPSFLFPVLIKMYQWINTEFEDIRIFRQIVFPVEPWLDGLHDMIGHLGLFPPPLLILHNDGNRRS